MARSGVVSARGFSQCDDCASDNAQEHRQRQPELAADAASIHNSGSVANHGTIDWSGSTGAVSSFYDMNGSYSPGTILANSAWTAAPYSGLVTQATGYKLVNSLTDLENISLDLAGNYALG
ncbi:hypothetical protein PQR02_24250 [Paraburkholderia sediminicola]|uniref:Uncharacterized protein n=1 Tax=Paraburkholderia rhynchosiae TaxID=487049 RepID=A0ACC7NML3_9BURK